MITFEKPTRKIMKQQKDIVYLLPPESTGESCTMQPVKTGAIGSTAKKRNGKRVAIVFLFLICLGLSWAIVLEILTIVIWASRI